MAETMSDELAGATGALPQPTQGPEPAKSAAPQTPFIWLHSDEVSEEMCGCRAQYNGHLAEFFLCPMHTAAPELLKAAKAFIQWADDCWGSWAINEEGTPRAKAEYDSAKAAIAKASARRAKEKRRQ